MQRPRQRQHRARWDKARNNGRGRVLIATRYRDGVRELRLQILHRSIPARIRRVRKVRHLDVMHQKLHWWTESVESAALLLLFPIATVLAVKAEGRRPCG